MIKVNKKSCTPNVIFLRENRFLGDYLVFRPKNLTLNSENVLFLPAHHSFNLQDIKISFENVDFYAKLSLILDTPVRNSTTQRTILCITCKVQLRMNV